MKIILLFQIITFIFAVTVSDKVRREERQITDQKMIEEFLDEQSIIRIGFYDKENDEVYIVPLNFGYMIKDEQFIFYMHGAKKGRRYELTKNKPNVGFEIDGNYELISGGDIACKHSAKYQSVIGNGILELLNDTEEKKFALNIIMEHTTGRSGFEYNPKMLENVGVYKLTATKLTCKAANL